MSARRARLVLTPRARQDLRDILQYSEETWGITQRKRYQAALLRRLRRLITYPELGPRRDEFFPGCRSLLVEQHGAYDRIGEREVVVGRILHQRQDPTGVVRDPSTEESA